MKYEYRILNSPMSDQPNQKARDQQWMVDQLNAFGRDGWGVAAADLAAGVVLLKREAAEPKKGGR